MRTLAFIVLFSFCNNLIAQDITGSWNGILNIQETQLSLVFHIENDGGIYTTTMDSPDQGSTGIPTDETTYENNELIIKASQMSIEYNGTWKEECNCIEGIFNQGPYSLTLTLSRKVVEKKPIVRPQDPTNFPYHQEEVSFINVNGGHKLAGTLTIPSNGLFESVEILITGSGPQNRDEELLNHRPFLVLSDHLTRNGIAVLRYDDRGIGESEGDFNSATTADFAEDVDAAIEFLKSRNDMQGKRIGLTGHSEGGMIAPIVASTNKDVDHIILLAGPGIDITDLLIIQTSRIAEAEGATPDVIEANSVVIKRVFNYLVENKSLSEKEVSAGLRNILVEEYETLSLEAKNEMGDKEEFFNQQISTMNTAWFRYFIGFDPADYLEKVKCPILAINGELDLQVTPKENLDGIKKAAQKAGNKNVTIKEFASLNHLFQVAPTGAPSEYLEIEETINEEVMNYLVNWIQAL